MPLMVMIAARQKQISADDPFEIDLRGFLGRKPVLDQRMSCQRLGVGFALRPPCPAEKIKERNIKAAIVEFCDLLGWNSTNARRERQIA